MTVQQGVDDTKPSILAAVLLWAFEILRELRATWPDTARAAIALVGGSHSQAYEMLARLKTFSGAIAGQPGRPPAGPARDDTLDVMRRVSDFLMSHPGTVSGQGERRTYSDDFRRFVTSLAAAGQPGADLTQDQLADAARVPLGTLKDWLRVPLLQADEPAATPSEAPPDGEMIVAQPRIRTILTEFEAWRGHFTAFCRHLREQHRLPYGDTFFGSVLAAAGKRDRRPRRRPYSPWGDGTFRTMFPGAQWLGDGTTIAMWLNGHCFAFNVEPMLDTASDAWVGVKVTDTENEQAVINAFLHGETTVGERPLALTLDNRPSNQSPAIEEAISPTTLLAATPGRGQAKAALEGEFGLFQQTAPPLVVQGSSAREVARSILSLVTTIWAWARNGRPRVHLGGRAPRDVYRQDRPSDDQIQKAKEWILELHRRAERARLTREALADPVRVALLGRGFADLGIPDPDGRMACRLARYGVDAITRGIATFASRKERDTLPADLEPHGYASFLGGIIRNLDIRFELERTAQLLLEQRIRARDLSLGPLLAQAQQIRDAVLPGGRPQAYVDRALESKPLIDFRFWSQRAVAALDELPAIIRHYLYPDLARRVAASFHTDWKRRADLIDRLATATAEPA